MEMSAGGGFTTMRPTKLHKLHSRLAITSWFFVYPQPKPTSYFFYESSFSPFFLPLLFNGNTVPLVKSTKFQGLYFCPSISSCLILRSLNSKSSVSCMSSNLHPTLHTDIIEMAPSLSPHRSLVRSVHDYGSPIYSLASSHLKLLNTI